MPTPEIRSQDSAYDMQPQDPYLDWLGFDPNRPVHCALYDCTLDDLVASLLSHKRGGEPRFVRLDVTIGDEEVKMAVLVRQLTQIYTPAESVFDRQVIKYYYDNPEWCIEGWIKLKEFNPSFLAPSVRCFFHADEGRLIEEAEVQFMNLFDLTSLPVVG